MKKLLLLFVLLFGFISIAQIVTIPDANFKAALLATNGLDANGDGEIQFSEAETLVYLFVENESISDLTGIEAFINIADFSCAGNEIAILDLSQNLAIRYALVGQNPLTFLNFGNNLTFLNVNIDDTLLETIDLSQNVNLQYLYCTNSRLTTIDLTSNDSLVETWLFGNSLTTLDLSNKPNLVTIKCSSQQIETINLNGSPNIVELLAEDNQLTALDVSGQPNLKFLEIGMNNLVDINFSNNVLLERLSCHTNSFLSIDVSQNVQLSEFWSYNNESLVSIDIKNGANAVMTSFVSFNSSEDICIQVDDEIAANAGTGVYQDWVTDSTVIFAEDCQLGVGEFLESSILLFPNPAANILNIQSELVITSIEIINVLGQSISSINGTKNFENIDVSYLSSGNYFVKVNTINSSSVHKIIKE